MEQPSTGSQHPPPGSLGHVAPSRGLMMPTTSNDNRFCNSRKLWFLRQCIKTEENERQRRVRDEAPINPVKTSGFRFGAAPQSYVSLAAAAAAAAATLRPRAPVPPI